MTARSAHRGSARPAGPSAARNAAVAANEGVRLVWPGRRWRMEEGQGSAPHAGARSAPRLFDVTPGAAPFTPGTGAGSVRMIHGDVLDLTRALTLEGLSGKVDLVYVDPPYASDRDYVAESRLDGPADGRVVRSPAYEDTWTSKAGGLGAYDREPRVLLEVLRGRS